MTTARTTRFHLGPPQLAGALAVYPIFGTISRLRYRGLRDAMSRGVFISELAHGASVNDVMVTNASDRPVLLYEGELITGAQQNRTLDQPVLIPAGAQINVQVSCVEQGRWDHSQHHSNFEIAPAMPNPELRSAKRAAANQSLADGLDGRADQGEVWSVVDASLARHGVVSPSQAFTDLFDAKDTWLREIRAQIDRHEDQLGMVALVDGKPVAFDLVSRPEVFAELMPGLLDGYAIQALDVTGAGQHEASDSTALDFLELVVRSRRRWAPTPGMGDLFTPTRKRIRGCGLRAERELVALSAFPA